MVDTVAIYIVDTVPRAECCSQSPSRDGALPQATPLERALGRTGLNFLPTALYYPSFDLLLTCERAASTKITAISNMT